MKEYVSPTVELISFGEGRISTEASNQCNCIAARWNYEEYDWDHCTVTTGDYSEIGDANSGL